MLFEELTEIGHLSGLFGIISICTSLLLGTIVLYKAIESKQRMLFLFFFTVIFTVSPWYPSGLSYIYWLITGAELYYQFYVLLGTVFVPIAIHTWLLIYTTLLHRKKKNIILIIYGVLSIFFYIYLFYFLFFAPGAPIENMIGIKRNPIDIEYKGFIFVYLGFLILTAMATGIEFSINSMKSDLIEVKWKGRFLIISFILFGIGAIADAVFELSVISLVIFRVILLLSSIFFYIGFIMPNWIKKILGIE
ncbi:MAG: hypothetical protein ACFFAN_14680 [Promethearchaeota archaeon]